MRSRRANRFAALVAAAAAVLIAGAPARADSTPAADFGLGLSSRAPSTGTGIELHIVFKNPSDASAKPSPQRSVVIAAPAGAVFDTGAVAACHASDAELMAQGPSGCPAESRVATGSLTLISGYGPPIDPFVDDVAIFNSGDGVVEVFNKKGSNTTTSVGRRALVAPNTLREDPAAFPGGPPDGETAVRSFDFHFTDARGPSGRPFIRTPPSCPSSRTWRSRISFTTADGHAYTARASTRCRPALRVEVKPPSVVAGRTARLVVDVRSTDSRCARDALVRVGSRRARTDAHGQATVRVHFHFAARRRVLVSRAGCGPGRAFVRVAG